MKKVEIRLTEDEVKFAIISSVRNKYDESFYDSNVELFISLNGANPIPVSGKISAILRREDK